MSLFIGNISSSVAVTDLEKAFGEYGRCSINYKGSYAFAEFDHEKEAESAFESLQNKNMGGRQINIEWSKKSKKFDETKCKRRRRSNSRKREGRCFNCGHRGHFLRDCTRRRERSKSKSKSRSRSKNKSNRSRSRNKSHSRSRSHSRRRKSTSRDRKHRRNHRKSANSSKSRSRSYKKKGRARSNSSGSRSRKGSIDNNKSPNKAYIKRSHHGSINNNKHRSQSKEKDNLKTASKENDIDKSKNNTKTEKADMYTSKLAQILGNDFSEQKPMENQFTNENQSISNTNEIKTTQEDKMVVDEKNGMNNTNSNSNSNNNSNGNSMKGEELKNGK